MIRTLDLVRRNLTNKDCTENEQTLHFFPVSGVEGRHDNESNLRAKSRAGFLWSCYHKATKGMTKEETFKISLVCTDRSLHVL